MGGGALGSKNVSKLGSKEVSKNSILSLRGSETTVAISLNINEITTQSPIARNDNDSHLERSERSQSYEILRLKPQNDNIFPLAPWGEGVRRTGEGLVLNNKKLDCHVANAPRNDIKSNPSQPSLRKGRRVAFTLAEVLITLGIIGVVAALTLPTVITNYQKRDIATRLKKDYSQINQVLQRINAEHGDIQIFTQSPNVFVPNYILPQYNGAKLYTTPNISNRHEKAMCYHANDPLSGANRAQYADLGKNGYISTPFMGYTTSIELPDGTCLGFNNSTTTNWANVQVFIDVNGSNKGPNILGNDLFYFSYDANTNSVKPYGYQYEETYCGTAVPNGVMHRGAGCAMKIMRDGWEIKKDYPWKGKR